jgi:hypothetical protein
MECYPNDTTGERRSVNSIYWYEGIVGSSGPASLVSCTNIPLYFPSSDTETMMKLKNAMEIQS